MLTFVGGCASSAKRSRVITLEGPGVALAGLTDFRHWKRSRPADGRLVLESPEIRSPWAWNELIVSWNVEPSTGAGLSVEAQALRNDRPTRFYRLGDWSVGDGAPVGRTSFDDQKDDDGRVKTDTLVLKSGATGLRLRLTLSGSLARHPKHLRLVTVSVCDSGSRPEPRPPRTDTWGLTRDVPERSQVAYPDGEGWCSPTSVSMVLGWWARERNRPDWDLDVPVVAAGVHDPAWPGTGNWPFNVAFAGSLGGLRACAARLRDLRDLEELIALGIPVVLSVNAPALRGQPATKDGGHLVVCIGFTPEGDVVINDPWARFEQGQRVRKICRRAHVERAWDHAHRLAYLVVPEDRLSVLPITWDHPRI